MCCALLTWSATCSLFRGQLVAVHSSALLLADLSATVRDLHPCTQQARERSMYAYERACNCVRKTYLYLNSILPLTCREG